MSFRLKAKAPFILVVAVAFFVYQLLILANSIEAELQIARMVFNSISSGNYSGPLFWLSSELIGEVGVILRFIGACVFMAFAAILLFKKKISWSLLSKGVLFEGVYYLFNLPFVVYLLTGSVSTASLGAALSYAGQMLLVTPIFLKLYLTLRKPNFDPLHAVRWLALAIVGFTFALWVKHFALALYALPFSVENAALLAGFVNSAVTLLAAGVLMILAFMPLIKQQSLRFKGKWFAAGLILMGVYVAVFLIISAVVPAYWVWISLIDWWILVMPILGLSLLLKK